MIEEIVSYLLFNVFGLIQGTRISDILLFFIADSIKIMLLLFFMIALIGYLRTYIPQEKIRRLLTGKKKGAGNVVAASLGALTPFCSCSSIPIFLGFLEAGIPLGVTFSFLITSPIVNEYVAILMLGFFGWKITLLYVIFGILVGIVGGMILGSMNLEKYLNRDIVGNKVKLQVSLSKTTKERLNYGLKEALSITKKLWSYILLGVGIGALIHNFVPEEVIHTVIASGGVFTVPVAVLLGVPIYGSCAAIVPIAIVLFEKGLPLGTALSFMMGISALSIPEAVILKKAMSWKLIAIFFGVVTVAIIVVGYLFNLLELWL